MGWQVCHGGARQRSFTPAGCGDEEYLQVFQEIVVPIADRYGPEWILVSAGFDPHRRDPLGGMNVTERGFAAMAALLIELARRHAGGRIAFLLEGGYDLVGLKISVASVLQEMAQKGQGELPAGPTEGKIQPLIRKLLQLQERYWPV